MTTKRALPSIMATGLHQRARQYIHLSTEICKKTKGRVEAIAIEPEQLRNGGIGLFSTTNPKVVLCEGPIPSQLLLPVT